VDAAKSELNKRPGNSGNRQMICEMSASGAKKDPHTVGGQNQGGGAGAGFQKWWADWNEIHLMNGMCNNNQDCKTAPAEVTTTTTTVLTIEGAGVPLTEWFCVANINRGTVTGPFSSVDAAKSELNKRPGNSGNRQMICEMSASGAKKDPHTVGGQNQGGGAGAGFQKWWADWNEIHLMNGMCNNNQDCKTAPKKATPTTQAPEPAAVAATTVTTTLTTTTVIEWGNSSYKSIGYGQCTDEDGVLVDAQDTRSLGWAYGGKWNGNITLELCKEACTAEPSTNSSNCGAIGYTKYAGGYCWLYAEMMKPYVKTNTHFTWYECFAKNPNAGS